MLRKAVALTAATLILLSASGDSAGAEQSDSIVQVLRTSNIAQVNRYVPKVFDLEHVNPFAVVKFLHSTIQPEEGGIYTFASPEGDSGKVLVICPEFQLDSISDLIGKIDRPKLTSSTGIARKFAKMRHRSVADAAFINTISANMQFGNAVIRTDPELNALYLEDLPTAMEDHCNYLMEEWDVPTSEVACDVSIYEVDVSNDGKIGLDYHAWKNGPGRNLFALGGFSEFEKVRNPLNQVGNSTYGYDPMYNSGSNIMGLPANRMNSHGYNFSWYYQVPSAYFDFLGVKGKARVVTKTRLSILNTRTGNLTTGEEFLYYLTQNGPAPVGGIRPAGYSLDPLGLGDQRVWDPGDPYVYIYTDPGQEPRVDVSRSGYLRSENTYPDNRTLVGQIANSGVRLQITPVIATDKITLAVSYEVSTLTGFDGEGRPQMSRRAVLDNRYPWHPDYPGDVVQSTDGAEIMLGGVVREAKVQQTTKVPVLGSIPVLGYWFGGETTTAQRTMVVVVLKTTVIQNFDSVTAEDKDLLAKVRGDVPAPLQEDEYGWDMYLFGGKEAMQ
jgi:type II secretory pathway component GspD/PulD (secretin)